MNANPNELSNANLKYRHPHYPPVPSMEDGTFLVNRLMSHSYTAKKKISPPSDLSLMNLASRFAPDCGFPTKLMISLTPSRKFVAKLLVSWGLDAEQTAAVSAILLGVASYVDCVLCCLGALGVCLFPSSL